MVISTLVNSHLFIGQFDPWSIRTSIVPKEDLTATPSDSNDKRTVKARRELNRTHTSNEATLKLKTQGTISHYTGVVLNAMKNLQLSIDKRFDEIQAENNAAIKQLQDRIGEVRKEFNNRMEGLSKKVEDKVNQTLKKNIEEKAKSIKKEMVANISKLNKQVKDVHRDIDRIKETVIPTLQEKLGDEIADLRGSVSDLREQLKSKPRSETSNPTSEENRHKNIIIRNIVQRENENVERRVNGLIQDS